MMKLSSAYKRKNKEDNIRLINKLKAKLRLKNGTKVIS